MGFCKHIERIVGVVTGTAPVPVVRVVTAASTGGWREQRGCRTERGVRRQHSRGSVDRRHFVGARDREGARSA